MLNKTLKINLFIIILAMSGSYLKTTHALVNQEPFDKRKQHQEQLLSEEILEPTLKELLLSNSVLRNSYNRAENITASQYLTPAVDIASPQLKKYYIDADTHTGDDNILHPTFHANVKFHKDFYYGLNERNQENNFNSEENKKQATPSLSNIKVVNSSRILRASITPNMSSSPSSTASLKSKSELDATNSISSFSSSSSLSYFERVELQESLTHTKNEKLLLHRNKRYLLFPEGSSFQLVFDLIIPIVDYTNFAIMGITCAVAWELPSKPPSEIIENFRTKLNDGTFGLIRRNDSTQQPLEYINSPRTEQNAVDDNRRWNEIVTKGSANVYNPNYQPSQQQRLSATVATTSGNQNFITNALKSATQPPLPPLSPPPSSSALTASSNFYYSHNDIQPENFQQPAIKTTPIFFYNQQLEKQKWNNYNNNFKTFDANQRKRIDASNDNARLPIFRKNNFTSSQPNNFYKYNNNDYKAYPIATNTWNVENWQTKKNYHQPYQQYPFKYPQNYIQQQQNKPQHTKIPYNDAGDYWNKDNWWDRNRNRIEKQWQENQHKWSQHQENQPNYQTPILSKRIGRNRKILNKPPKHRVYPVFGKRRRRRSSSHLSDDELAKKLQGIHTREHLQTRQKLYGKIEKLYKTRGQNGTACVLRALCETERMHINTRHHEAPQSFVMELLRSIFALPKDTLTNSKDSSLHLDARYTKAVLLAHDTTQSCSQQYYDCEYSITYGT